MLLSHLVLQIKVVRTLQDCSIVDSHTHTQQQERSIDALLLQAAALEHRTAQGGSGPVSVGQSVTCATWCALLDTNAVHAHAI